MKYRKKPVVIEAFQWFGDIRQTEDPEWFIREIKNGNAWCDTDSDSGTFTMKIKTLEGIMRANQGDYIIKGVKDEIYPCKPEIFEETYEEV